jgi:hypothetical protein
MNRKNLLIIVPIAAALASASLAVAQTTPPSATPPASNDKGAPKAGANSFTEKQAMERIQKAGYTQVTGLKKDDQGVWRGSAMKGGKQMPVSVDYRGNVLTN